MGQTTSAFSAVLKNVYIDKIREQLNQNTNLLDFFTEADMTQYEWRGKQLVLALHNARNASGVKYTSEGGGLPVAGQQGYTDALIPSTFLHGRIQLTAQVMKASQGSQAAFATAMNSEMKGLVNDLSRQRNRALAYFGQGTLATISSGANSTTQTLANPGGVTGTTNPLRFIQNGMIVTVTSNDGNNTIRGTATVNSNNGTNQITLSSSINTTTGDLVQIGTNSLGSNESSYNLEAMGILGIVDGTTYVSVFEGIDASQAANAFWKSTVMGNTGVLSPDVLQRGTDNAWEISGEVIDGYIAHVSVRREILKITEGDRRYQGSNTPINPDAGTQAGAFKKDITFNGTPVRVDKDFAYGTLVGVNKSHLLWFPETKGEWVDDDGDVLFRLQNTDAFEARYRLFENFGTDKRDAHVRFDGVTATVSSGVYSG